MEILGLLMGLFIVLLLLFYAFAYPVWMIIDCGISIRSTAAKVGWIVLIVFSWTLGAALYGLIAAKGGFVKFLSLIGLLSVVAFIGVTYVGIQMAMPMLENAPEMIAKELAKLEHPEISAEEMVTLEARITSILKETPNSFRNLTTNPELLQDDMLLLESLADSAEDHTITREELQRWNELYEDVQKRRGADAQLIPPVSAGEAVPDASRDETAELQ